MRRNEAMKEREKCENFHFEMHLKLIFCSRFLSLVLIWHAFVVLSMGNFGMPWGCVSIVPQCMCPLQRNRSLIWPALKTYSKINQIIFQFKWKFSFFMAIFLGIHIELLRKYSSLFCFADDWLVCKIVICMKNCVEIRWS